jgi:hypothetical protein
MIRLHIFVEGPSEKRFIDDHLAFYLGSKDIHCDAMIVKTGTKMIYEHINDVRNKVIFKGGGLSYKSVEKQIQLRIKEDHRSDSFFTTMFDYYALGKDFPRFR